MGKQVFVNTSGLAHFKRCDKQTVVNHVRRGKIEPSAFLQRNGKLVPLFAVGQEETSTYEAEIIPFK
jgi:hypothetical protein